MKAQLLIMLLILCPITFAEAAQSVTVQTKPTYHYGEYLLITINVSKVTAKTAILTISDSHGGKGSAIAIQIKNPTTTITAPNPFNSELFSVGKYQIQVEYDGVKASTPFELKDIGNVVMPYGSDVIVPQWAEGKISDSMFYKFLVSRNLIKSQDSSKTFENITIPNWYKTNGKWWSTKNISDAEFINGLQFLVNQNIIKG